VRRFLQSAPTRRGFIGILGGMEGAGRKVDAERPEFGPQSRERLISRFAAQQHGVVSRAAARQRAERSGDLAPLRTGRLHRLHQSVYAVGHTLLTTRGRWMAAVLASGPGAP
jgi:hypothetical protein